MLFRSGLAVLGLSFKTPQYGIGTANIVAFELVLPSGQVTTVTNQSNPDLFFAVRVSAIHDPLKVFYLTEFCRARRITL